MGYPGDAGDGAVQEEERSERRSPARQDPAMLLPHSGPALGVRVFRQEDRESVKR